MRRSLLALIVVVIPAMLHAQPRVPQPVAARPTHAFAPAATAALPIVRDSVEQSSRERPFARFALVGAMVGAVVGGGFVMTMCDGACDNAAPLLGGAAVGAGVGALTGVALALGHDGARLRRMPAR